MSAQALAFTVHVAKPILWTAQADHFMGFVACLAEGTLIPVQNASVQVHDVHAIVYLVQQRLVGPSVDWSRGHDSLKSGGQKKLGSPPESGIIQTQLSTSTK